MCVSEVMATKATSRCQCSSHTKSAEICRGNNLSVHTDRGRILWLASIVPFSKMKKRKNLLTYYAFQEFPPLSLSPSLPLLQSPSNSSLHSMVSIILNIAFTAQHFSNFFIFEKKKQKTKNNPENNCLLEHNSVYS